MDKNQKVYLGVLGKPKGLRGAIRIHLYNPESTLLQKNLQFYIEGEKSPFVVESFSNYQKAHLLQIKNHADINLIEKYKGKKIYVLRNQLNEEADNEYYHVDLVGCAVENEEGISLGNVKEVIATGANDVLSIMDLDNKETLIPFIDPYVIEVDLEKKVIKVIVPEVLS